MSERRPRTEQQLVELLRAIDAPAPERLHRHVEALVQGDSERHRRAPRLPRPLLRLGLPGLAALAAVLVVLLAAGGGSGGFTLQQAAALTLSPARMPAPPLSRSHAGELTANVEGVAFPAWERLWRLRPTGARLDRVGGRTVRTIFYAGVRGQRIGYAIVGGLPAPAAAGAVSWRDGVAYHLLSEHGTSVVAWEREGRLCVLSGRGVSASELLALAS